jgi:L-alanine-DL-glutamate epimerase-like enolase superfamily enzyme
MKITEVLCHVLVSPSVDVGSTISGQDDFVVEVRTDAGITGFGESDVNPWLARTAIEAPGSHTMGRCLRDLLIGADPLDPAAIWDEMYVRSAMNGRRGAVIHAIGAVDMALWDIAGKAAGVPTYQLLGPARRAFVTPYASLLPPAPSYERFRDTMVQWTVRAQDLGYRAVKLEPLINGPYRHGGLDEPDERITEIVAACRSAVGAEMVLMVDVGYAWDDAERAARTLEQWRDLDVYFIETPLRSDDVAGYAELHRANTGIPIATGEWLATRWEFHEALEHGMVDVAQPDIGRVGGLTEALAVDRLAASLGRRVIPHSVKSHISAAAAVHFAAVSVDCPYIEYLPQELSDRPIRHSLTSAHPRVRAGIIELPTEPGLGVIVDPQALARFKVA